MKAIVRHEYGDTGVLRLDDVDPPALRPGDLLIRVHAAAVDRGVWHLMTGLPYLARLALGLRRPRDPLLGRDVAGVVAAVGADVTGFRPGDEVYGEADGSFAELTRAPAGRCAVRPAGLSFAEAAAVPVSGCTALSAVRDAARVQAGQSVLVIGASGGVGSFAVQIAAAYGAHVTGVCRTDKTDLVRSLGAHDVIDYTRQDVTDGSRRFDVILDIGGNRTLTRLRRALTDRGTLVVVGGEEGGRLLQGVDRQLRAVLVSPFVRHRLTGLISSATTADLDTLSGLIGSGALTPAIDRSYPLAAVPDAIRRLSSGEVRGKIVVTV